MPEKKHAIEEIEICHQCEKNEAAHQGLCTECLTTPGVCLGYDENDRALVGYPDPL